MFEDEVCVRCVCERERGGEGEGGRGRGSGRGRRGRERGDTIFRGCCNQNIHSYEHIHTALHRCVTTQCVCVCVCVCEGEGQGEGGGGGGGGGGGEGVGEGEGEGVGVGEGEGDSYCAFKIGSDIILRVLRNPSTRGTAHVCHSDAHAHLVMSW